MLTIRWSRAMHRAIVVGAVLLTAACGGDGGGEPVEPQGDFTFAISPATLSLQQGQSGTVNVTVSRSGGFAGAVTGSVEGLPAGVTLAPFSVAAATSSAIVTVSVGATVAPGNYPIVVRAQASGIAQKQANLTLTVTAAPAPAATIAVNPAAVTVQAGANGTSQATITRTGGFAGEVTLTTTGAPTGMTVTTPAIAAGATTSAITIAVGANVPAAVYPITVRANGTGITEATAVLTVTVTAAPVPSATITVNPTAITVQAGAVGTSQATITRGGGFAGAVTLTNSGAPTGMTVAAPDVAAGASTSAVTVTVGANVAPGEYPVVIRANGTGITESTATLTVTVTAAAGFTAAIDPAALSLAPGEQGTAAINVTRSGGFAGALTVALEGNAPTGVTVTVPAPIAGATGNVTVAAGAQAAAGAYPLVFNITGTGVPARTVTLTLTVTSLGGMTLASNPATVSVTQGQTAQATVTITRTAPFVAPVQLAVTNLPNGVSAAVNPNPVAGNTATITFTATGAASVGTVNATVTGTGGGVTSTPLTLPVTVAQSGGGGAGNVTYNFCSISGLPMFVAYQDGNNAWVRATVGANNTYTFNIGSGRGGVAYVVDEGGFGTDMQVEYGTVAELNAFGSDNCDGTFTTGRNFTGTVSGVGLDEFASVVAGNAIAQVGGGTTSYELENVAPGPFDLLAARFSLAGGAGKFVIRRNLNPANNSVLAPIDFNGAEAFDPIERTVTVNNSMGQDLSLFGLYFLQGGTAGGAPYFIEFDQSPATTRTYYGVPDARRASSDLHIMFVFATSGANQELQRATGIVFGQAVDKAVTLPATLGATNVTSLGASGGNARLRASYTAQQDYLNSWFATYTQGGVSITTTASAAYMGGTSVVLDVPDLAGLSGWNTSWGLVTGQPVDWQFSANGWSASSLGSPQFEEGTLVRSASRSGTITP